MDLLGIVAAIALLSFVIYRYFPKQTARFLEILKEIIKALFNWRRQE